MSTQKSLLEFKPPTTQINPPSLPLTPCGYTVYTNNKGGVPGGVMTEVTDIPMSSLPLLLVRNRDQRKILSKICLFLPTISTHPIPTTHILDYAHTVNRDSSSPVSVALGLTPRPSGMGHDRCAMSTAFGCAHLRSCLTRLSRLRFCESVWHTMLRA